MFGFFYERTISYLNSTGTSEFEKSFYLIIGLLDLLTNLFHFVRLISDFLEVVVSSSGSVYYPPK